MTQTTKTRDYKNKQAQLWLNPQRARVIGSVHSTCCCACCSVLRVTSSIVVNAPNLFTRTQLGLEPCGACAMYDDVLTQDERDKAHSSVRVDVLCVENSHGGHVVIGVGIVRRHHANITYQLLNSHF